VITVDAPVVWFDGIDSTNAEALRRTRAGDFGPAWLEAGAQTAGRGRRGRAWLSEPGNVFTTYLGHTPEPPQAIALLGFAAGLAVADLADAALGRGAARLKWPNDVLIDGAKLSGILLESGAAPKSGHWFVLGVGVNAVSAPEPEGAAYPITSLAAHGASIPAEVLRAQLRAALAARAGQLRTAGFSPLRADWMARAHGIGRDVRAEIAGQPITGRALELGPDGALRIEAPDGAIHSISAGEVYFTP
jgi:BirA family biotin operon repressor/biotin-[acetyl-CoA-carboxylase] ligase